jgi:multiple sugar transport system permease protein
MTALPSPRSASRRRPFLGKAVDRQKQVVWAWTFLALPILFYRVFRFYPTLEAFYLSLTDWDLLNEARFIGLDNYRKLFADPVFWQVFRNTFALSRSSARRSACVLSFAIAYYLDRVRFLHGFIRALYFLPF